MRAGQRVHLQLRTEILNGDLAPGAPLGEVELSERFGTSRTPVREALGLLAADGLAEQAPGRGIVVADLSLEQADQLFDLRIALESLLARRAAQRATPEAAERSSSSSPVATSTTEAVTFPPVRAASETTPWM